MKLMTVLYVTHILSGDYNEGLIQNNQGFGVSYKDFYVTTMVNSHSKRSYMTYYDADLSDNWGFFLGGTTGYEHVTGLSVSPFAAPYFKYDSARVTLFGNAVAVTWEFNVTK